MGLFLGWGGFRRDRDRLFQRGVEKRGNSRDIRLWVSKVSLAMLRARKMPEHPWFARRLIELHGVVRMDDGIIESMNKQDRARSKPRDLAPWLNLVEVIACSPEKNDVCDATKQVHGQGECGGWKMKGLENGHLNRAPV